MSSFGYQNLTACTQVPENSTYLSNTHISVPQEAVSTPTLGLLMLLSTLQYQPTYVDAKYQAAANSAGKAAFTQVGGQAFQDKATNLAGKKAIDLAHGAGITDMEGAVVLGGYKIYKDRQVNVNGPRIGIFRSHLTVSEKSGSIGLRYEW